MDERDGNTRIGRLLANAYRLWQDRTYAGLADRGFPEIRPAHSPVFRLLEDGGKRVSDMAAQANITKQSMAYLVEDLEKLGFVEVGPDPQDGRAKLVSYTARGRRAEKALRTLSLELEAKLADAIGVPQLEAMRAALLQASRAHD